MQKESQTPEMDEYLKMEFILLDIKSQFDFLSLQHKPSLMKFGKSLGALFSFCLRLFCSSKRFSSYGFLLLVFPEEGKVRDKPDETKTKRRNLRLKFSFLCNTHPLCRLALNKMLRVRT